MTLPTARELIVRAPSNRVHRLSLDREFVVIKEESAKHVHGQWLIYSESKRHRMVGVHRSTRMESVGEALLFSVDMTDTGAEFAVILHEAGVLVLCIQLSPVKCSIATYHEYLQSYCTIIGVPTPGARSVAGGDSDEGRVPTPEEFTFGFIRRALAVVEYVGQVKADLSKHERGMGGESGIDARKTLEAWKSHPDWYAPATNPDETSAIKLGRYAIRPLRAAHRESLGTNRFIGAATIALLSLAGRVARGAVGGMAALLLADSAKRLRKLDNPTPMSISEAWKYLESASLPRRSRELAKRMSEFKSSLMKVGLHLPSPDGRVPFFLAPPELIFQDFVIAKCLLGLGLPAGNLQKAIAAARTTEGCRFGPYVAWADTSNHYLQGWRDGTSKPSAYEPDLVVADTHLNRTLMLDAKFRRDDTGLLPASGIKDIQAYMQEYELSQAVIAVPTAPGDVSVEDVSGRGFTVRGIALSPETGATDIADLRTYLDKVWNNKLVTNKALTLDPEVAANDG